MNEIYGYRVEWTLKERLEELNRKSDIRFTQMDIALGTGIHYNTLNSYFNNYKGELNMRRIGLIAWWFCENGLEVGVGDLIRVVNR